MLPVWIGMPHIGAMIQMCQPANDREVVDDGKGKNSRNVKSAESDVMKQKPESEFVCLFVAVC